MPFDTLSTALLLLYNAKVFGEAVVYHADELLKDRTIMKRGVGRRECERDEVSGDVQRKIVEDYGAEAKIPGDCGDVESGDGSEKCEKREQKDDDTPHEEVLYQVLLDVGREEGLELRIRALFTSCQSKTAQENLLISLRCAAY